MMRMTAIACAIAVIGMATWTYSVKHQADERLSQIKRLESAVETEKETIELLRADWSLLSQPSRIQALVEQFGSELQLGLTQAHQIAAPDSVPMLPEPPGPASIEDILAESGDFDLTTGSIAETD